MNDIKKECEISLKEQSRIVDLFMSETLCRVWELGGRNPEVEYDKMHTMVALGHLDRALEVDDPIVSSVDPIVVRLALWAHDIGYALFGRDIEGEEILRSQGNDVRSQRFFDASGFDLEICFPEYQSWPEDRVDQLRVLADQLTFFREIRLDKVKSNHGVMGSVLLEMVLLDPRLDVLGLSDLDKRRCVEIVEAHDQIEQILLIIRWTLGLLVENDYLFSSEDRGGRLVRDALWGEGVEYGCHGVSTQHEEHFDWLRFMRELVVVVEMDTLSMLDIGSTIMLIEEHQGHTDHQGWLFTKERNEKWMRQILKDRLYLMTSHYAIRMFEYLYRERLALFDIIFT